MEKYPVYPTLHELTINEQMDAEIAPGRPLSGDLARIFIPKPEAVFASNIAYGSGVVGYYPNEQDKGDGKDIVVYYEGNLFGAENMVKWADKVRMAYGRMVDKYPTSAFSSASSENFELVGVTDGNMVECLDMDKVCQWADLSKDVDSAPSQTIERRPERLRPKF